MLDYYNAEEIYFIMSTVFTFFLSHPVISCTWLIKSNVFLQHFSRNNLEYYPKKIDSIARS